MKKKYVVLQEEISDCGVCSLLSIIKYYKGFIPLEELRINSLTDNKGVTAYNLIECAKKYGFQAEGLKVDEIVPSNLPCIAHLNINKSLSHFVAVYEISNNKISYMDPSTGYVKESLEEFNKKFDNIIINLKPRTIIIKKETKKIIQNLINSELKKTYKKFIAILILNIIIIFITILSAFFYKYLFEDIFIISLVIIGSNLIISILKYLIEIKSEKYENKVEQNIMSSYFDKLLKLPLYYLQLKGNGEIQKRVLDIENIVDIIIKSKIKISLNILIIIISSLILMYLKKGLLVLVFIYLFLVVIITKRYSLNINKRINEDIFNQTDYNNTLIEIISGIKTINHTNSKIYFKELLANKKSNSLSIAYILKKDISKYNILISIIYIIINLLINIILLIEIKKGLLIVEYYFIITSILNFLIEAIMEVIQLYPNLHYKNNIINKVNDFLSIDFNSSFNEKIENYDITFKNVYFSYNNIDNILKNISFDIKEGEKVYLKGNNGTGKSTISKLLSKELENYKGHILIGNKDISILSKEEVCNYISYISQDEKIFSMTIKENITLGLECEDKLNEVIELCELHVLLDKMPFHLDTFLIGGGEELSAGEKELIILARHLIRDNKIIIIDEATSHIANHLENKIIKNIKKSHPNKTIIFISHKNKEFLFERTIKLQ